MTLKESQAWGIRVNIDSTSELKRLKKFKQKNNEISIRMDPGINGHGHGWQVTIAGRRSHGVPIKFSIPKDEVINAAVMCESHSLRLVGLHEHIGSNWVSETAINEFLDTLDIVLKKANQISKVLKHDLRFIDLGSGPGVRYGEKQKAFPLDKYAKLACRRIEDSQLEVQAIGFEPGRYIVADAGIMLMEVVDIKKGTTIL